MPGSYGVWPGHGDHGWQLEGSGWLPSTSVDGCCSRLLFLERDSAASFNRHPLADGFGAAPAAAGAANHDAVE